MDHCSCCDYSATDKQSFPHHIRANPRPTVLAIFTNLSSVVHVEQHRMILLWDSPLQPPEEVAQASLVDLQLAAASGASWLLAILMALANPGSKALRMKVMPLPA